MTDCNIKVICRFRPQNEREKQESANKGGESGDVNIELQKQTVNINNKGQKNTFTLDSILPSSTRQEEIYEIAAKPTVVDLLNGYNGTIFAYGQTGAGKSFTMFGPDVESQPQLRGIIPRSIALIFDTIMNDSSGSEFTIKCSFLEIYKENVHDLLNPKSGPLKVRETPARGVWVEDLMEEFVTSEKEVLDLIRMGEKCRSVAYTKMNATSSRSHSLFTLILQQKSPDGSVKTGKLNLADLAGSEKVGKTGAVGETLDEAKKINQSLSALGNCINALTKQKRGHVPFRDSKLTFILRESLGGNSKTTLIVNCSPDKFNIDETVSTLQFAQRAKMIKNSVSVNKQRSVEELNQIIAKLQKEIAQLKLFIQGLGHQVPKALDVVDHELEAQVGTPTKGGDGAESSYNGTRVDSEEHEALQQELTDSQSQLTALSTQMQTVHAELETIRKQLEESTQVSETRSKELQEAQERYQAAETKWGEERDGLKQAHAEAQRKVDEKESKIKILQEQMSEGNARFDHMVNELKSKGNDAQAQLAEQLMETEGTLRHRELIISELAEQLADEQASKSQAQEMLAEAKANNAISNESIQRLERQVAELAAKLQASNRENQENNELQERMAARLERLEAQNASYNTEVQELIAKISELSTPPSSPTQGRRNIGGNKSKIVRPVAKNVDNRKSTSLGNSIWNLFSPTKIFGDDNNLKNSEEMEMSAFGHGPKIWKQGYLFKQGANNLKSWKRRKCILRTGMMVIVGENDRVKGSIPIDVHTVAQQTDEFTFKKNSFGIFHPANPTHFFYAETADDCSLWVETLLAVVEKAKM